ncbi:MAG: NAD(P)-dependent oxidoreductase [Dehalococcoidia bacterium]|jgi:nucleoside-diphosphate-sugar epimerase
MKVLLTGAFGNVGSNALESLIEQGHQVTCFDIKTKANTKASKRFQDKVKIIWGDLRHADDVKNAVKDHDVVVHLAYIIPPASEKNPDWAKAINVGGTQNLVNALKSLPQPPKLIFSSSISIYGPTADKEPPRRASDPVCPTDNYTHHKAECERMVRESGLSWSILRFAAVPLLGQVDPMMFEVPLNTRIEYVHPKDVGLAVANAAGSDKVWGKILLIGGGTTGQFRYKEYLTGLMDGAGIGMPPDEAFTTKPFYTDWMDTEESQRLLQYQRYPFEQYVKEMPSALGYKYHMSKMLRPLIRKFVLSKSPYYKSKKATV